MGIKIISEYKDPHFKQGSPAEHKLSVLLRPDGLCFHVTDAAHSTSFAWKELAGDAANELLAAAGREPLLSGTAYSSAILATCGPAALAPARLFDPSHAADYWLSLSDLPAGYSVQADAIPVLDAYVVYPLDGQSVQALPGARNIHLATAWLSGIYRHALRETGPAIYAHTSGKQLMLAAFDGRALRFFNTFTFQTAQDFLYFVLLALDQAQFALEQTLLFVSGKMTSDSEIHLLLQRYFVDMQFLTPAAAAPYPAGLPDDRRHWYFDLACIGSL